MDSETTRRLNRLNRSFYEHSAEDFSRTRGAPWGGWERIVDAVGPTSEPEPVAILDVGCGNGRFAPYASRRLGAIDYLGLDSSEALLRTARDQAASLAEGSRCQLARCDLVEGSLEEAIEGRAFHLITVFGVMHHLPGFDNRRALLVTLREHLLPGGLLAVSFWQFGASERFLSRTRAWEDFNRTADEPIDLTQIEDSDLLLAWGEGDAFRYCHFADPAEVERLLESSGLASAETYFADGHGDRLNLYALIRG